MPLHWFVAYVRSCQERRLSDVLSNLGVEHYLPVQVERRKWSDRIKVVDRLVLPGMMFIRTTEPQRVRLLQDISLICRFMSKGGSYNPVRIPDGQMDDFRFMVSRSSGKVTVSSEKFLPGEKIEIASGPLKGFRCEIVRNCGELFVAVRLEMLGTAIVEVSAADIRKYVPSESEN